MLTGGIYGILRTTNFVVKEFARLGPDYPIYEFIEKDYKDLYTKGGDE